MSQVSDAVSAALAAEIRRRTQWDEQPAVFMCYLSGGAVSLRQLAIPPAVWPALPPPDVLAAIADAGQAGGGVLREAVPPGLHAVAFFGEVWRAEDDVALLADRLGGSLESVPGRVEAREIWAVDRSGLTYNAWQVRGDSTVHQKVISPAPGPDPDELLTGGVPAALDRLLTGLLGVSLSPRMPVQQARKMMRKPPEKRPGRRR